MSKKKTGKGRRTQTPRRFTPMQSKRITGWLMILGIVISLVAIHFQQVALVGLAAVEWLISLCFMLWYWRCPGCGKSLPKSGIVTECPRCGAKID